ncbi:uncharacterized protein LOC128709317 [Anopheles marshallii]|uniref:uncharacterized protein LOC128709317 n=1 Tax=Anopheles marshallii TaxID=1521116 RepID=UPI00237C4A56|nr:uncharacterized protein LOC128709317 [Anopheles marshallii]
MESFDSVLNLTSKSASKEDVDFTLQKARIEEAFEELLNDLEALERVETYLKKQPTDGEDVWKELQQIAIVPNNYPKFQHLLKELDEKAKVVTECSTTDPVTHFIRQTIEHVRITSEQSLLRPPSPPIIIKNRAEHETFRWARVIALQESKIESLTRKIEEYERKILERKAQRQRLQQRSELEKEEQLNASQHVLVALKLEGDVVVQRLQEQLAVQPHVETAPEYLSQLDQQETKRKRIAKMEVQLQLWVKKYDKFIGEPMVALRELEDRMAGLDEWRDTVFRPQEDRLRQLQEQIGAFEAIALEEKIEEMRKLHAVRVLQRAWKRTLEIKPTKKKGKKGKKGKK